MSSTIQKILLLTAMPANILFGAGIHTSIQRQPGTTSAIIEHEAASTGTATTISVPSGVVAVASGTQVQVSWNASSGGSSAISYDVYRNGSHYAYAATTSCADVAVYPGVSYSYQVLGYNDSGVRSTLSQTASATVQTPGVTAPSEAPDYRLVYSNDFNSLDMGQNWTGQFHDWYTSQFGAIKPVSASRASVANSILSLDWLAGDGVNDSAVASFDLGSLTGRAFRYGYFEASMKWNPVAGAWPAFWLLSTNATSQNGQWGELDAFEGHGLEPGVFFGTVHDWTAVNGVLSQTANSANSFSLGLANDYSQWHKYGVLWQPGSITWYFDDHPVLTAPEPTIMASQDVELILEMAEGLNWVEGDTTGVTASEMLLSVDWVRVWQHNPVIATTSTNGIAFRDQ